MRSSMSWIRTASCSAVVGLLTATSAFAVAPESDRPTSRIVAQVSQATEDAAASLQLIDYTVQRPEFIAGANGSRTAVLSIDGVDQVLTLRPKSFRADDYRLLIDDGAGGLREVDAPASRTYRGITSTGKRAVASDMASGWSVAIDTGNEMWYAEPARQFNDDAPAGDLIVYRDLDVVEFDMLCGNNEVPMHAAARQFIAGRGGAATAAAGDAGDTPISGADTPEGPAVSSLEEGEFYLTEIGIDVDFPFFQRNSSNLDLTTQVVDQLISLVSLIYERDAQVLLVQTGTVIRTSSASDPYGSLTDSDDLLNQMRNVWTFSGSIDIRHDVAHMFSGRNFDGSTIGLAFLDAVCQGSIRYGINQVSFSGSSFSRSALIAHELGHNFSARHCNGAPGGCQIMCDNINGCDGAGLPDFAPVPLNSIISWAESASCLSVGSGNFLAPPLLDTFPTATLSPDFWDITNDVQVASSPIPAPSGTNVLELIDEGELQSVDLNAGLFPEDVLRFSFQFTTEGTEAGEDLEVEVLDNRQRWRRIVLLESFGLDLLPYEYIEVGLPFAARYAGARFRFRGEGDEPNDAWYIDDVAIDVFESVNLPLTETFERGFDRQLRWFDTTSSTLVSTDGTGFPTQDLAASLTTASTLETRNLNLAVVGVGNGFGLTGFTSDANAGDLVVEIRTPGSGDFEIARLSAADYTTGRGVVAVLPPAARVNDSTLRLTVENGTAGAWTLEQIRLGFDFNCGQSDLAEPQGILNSSDVNAFLGSFLSNTEPSDLAEPFGIWNSTDINAFVAGFLGGCP
ncbi:MAG: zinc-dependent metalloprotease family protein [Planctomycetota bacterium]